MAESNDILQQAKKVWSNLGGGQKVAAGAITLVVFAGIMAAAILGGSADYKQLIANVPGKELSAVISQLDDAGITDYKIVDGGAIHVPSESYELARTTLYRSGTLPNASQDPEENSILPGGGLSRDERARSENRKTEKRLERTLTQMGYIDQADVTITGARNRYFKGGDSPAKASVIVKTRGTLSSEQVKTIAHVVASGVESLSADAVTIHNTLGLVLKSPSSTAETGDQEARLAYESQIEQSKTGKVQALLDRVYGRDKVLVAVDVNLDWTRMNTKEKKFDSEGKVVREKMTQESTKPAGSSNSNGATGNNALNNGGQGAKAAVYKDSTKKETNDFGFKESTLVTMGGSITRMTASVFIDESLKALKDEIQQTVSGAIGIDTTRRDTIEVMVTTIEGTEAVTLSDETESTSTTQTIFRWWDKVAYIVLGLVFVFFALRTIKKAQSDLRNVLEASIEEENREVPVQPLTLEEQVLETATDDTELAGRSLRRWLYEGAGAAK